MEPCEGHAPYLCVSDPNGPVGVVEFLVISLATHPEFQQIVRGLGLDPEAIDMASQAYRSAAVPALMALADSHLDVIEEDRAITYGDSRRFVRLEPQPVQFGQLPGMALGFYAEDEQGLVQERYLSYATFDGHAIYWIGANYDPANVVTFTSDEAVTTFASYLEKIIAGLRWPAPEILPTLLPPGS